MLSILRKFFTGPQSDAFLIQANTMDNDSNRVVAFCIQFSSS